MDCWGYIARWYEATKWYMEPKVHMVNVGSHNVDSLQAMTTIDMKGRPRTLLAHTGTGMHICRHEET